LKTLSRPETGKKEDACLDQERPGGEEREYSCKKKEENSAAIETTNATYTKKE